LPFGGGTLVQVLKIKPYFYIMLKLKKGVSPCHHSAVSSTIVRVVDREPAIKSAAMQGITPAAAAGIHSASANRLSSMIEANGVYHSAQNAWGNAVGLGITGVTTVAHLTTVGSEVARCLWLVWVMETLLGN